jgi:drug/metabolite transporter (DMT)-like permease
VRRILLLALIWGWSFLFIKVAVEGMSPAAVAAARISLGALVMYVALRARRTPLPRGRVIWTHFAFQGVVGSVLPFTLLAWAEQYVSTALTAVLNASTPLFAVVLSAVFLSERLTRAQLLGVAMGFLGVAIAAGVGASDLSTSSIGGSLAAIGAGVCYAMSFIYARRHLGSVPSAVAATGQLIAGAVFIVPIGIATSIPRGIELAPHRILAVLILGVVGTGYAYLLNYRNINQVGATRASVVTQLIPVVAVAVGVVFLGEPFRWRLVVGGGLTLLGIAVLHDRVRARGTRVSNVAPQ